MIYDLILIALFLLMIIIGSVRGAAKALAGILVSIVSFLAATYLGRMLSTVIYESLIKPAIDSTVNSAISNLSVGTVTKVNETAPGWLAELMKLSNVDLQSLAGGKLPLTADAACEAVSNAVKPTAVDIITFLLTVILFLLLRFILGKLLIKPLLNVFRLPGIRALDSVLGGLIGFVEAFLTVSMLSYLLKLLMPYIGSESGILNESTIYNSFIFYHFYSGNIFTVLVSWIK